LFRSAAAPHRDDGECNVFFHPMGEGVAPNQASTLVTFDHNKELSFQLQVGSRLFPEYPINSTAEAFYQLRKTLGIHFGANSVNLNSNYYLARAFDTAIDMEKVLGASFTGMNTMSGDLLTIRMKPANGSAITMDASTVATYSLHYTFVYDSIIDLGLTGVHIKE